MVIIFFINGVVDNIIVVYKYIKKDSMQDYLSKKHTTLLIICNFDL